jgi:hypothetical protein
MSQVIFNSFPRSANVYLGRVSAEILISDYATVHIPEIFSVKEIYNVTVFRKPEDSISSLINKRIEVSSNTTDLSIKDTAKELSNLYRKYMMYAKNNSNNIYIAKFDDIIENTVENFLNISKKFEIKLNDNYEERFKSISFSGRLWEDRYDGHYPREKHEDRLHIEELVGSLGFIQELNKDYEDFIEVYATKKV